MKYRIIKKTDFDGEMYHLERREDDAALSVWRYVTGSTTSSEAEIHRKLNHLVQKGEPREEVIKEVEIG